MGRVQAYSCFKRSAMIIVWFVIERVCFCVFVYSFLFEGPRIGTLQAQAVRSGSGSRCFEVCGSPLQVLWSAPVRKS